MAAPGDLLFKLSVDDGHPGAGFGKVLAAVDGDILVGEPGRLDVLIDAPGRAYLFDGVSGELKHTFNNPELTDQDVFAHALTGGDGRVFISTRGILNRVYVFSSTTGEFIQTIHEPESHSSGFGHAVAYGDGTLAVSSPSYGFDGMLFVGQGHLFDAIDGELARTIPNPEPGAGEAFGSGISLAVFGDKVAFGTIADASFDGRVWVFDRHTGEVAYALDNPNPSRVPPLYLPDWFGWSVAANEDLIVVSAQEDSTAGAYGSGTVYVFDSDTGALRHTLFSPHVEENGEFGRSLAVTPQGDILVGAWGTHLDGPEATGRVYLFDGDTGSLLLDIPNPEPTEFAGFGWSVAAVGDKIVIGAPSADANGIPSTGAVYVYQGVPEPATALMAVSAICVLLGRMRLRPPPDIRPVRSSR